MVFVKGQTGNAGGKPRTLGSIRELARQQTEKAIKTLIRIMDDTESSNNRAAVEAAKAILDRGWGKPEQSVQMTVSESAIDAPKQETMAEWMNRRAQEIMQTSIQDTRNKPVQ